MSTSSYNRLTLVRISRRSYRSYSYAELMLIPNLCLFKTPVEVTELILIQNLYLTDLCLSRTPVGVTELILNKLMFIQDSRRSYRTYTYNRRTFIQDSRRSYRVYSNTGVPLGTTELMKYESTRRYYKT